MKKFLLVVCVSLLLVGGLSGMAEANRVEATFYVDGVDLDTGMKFANPAVLLIVVGSPDKIQQLLAPADWTLEYFDYAVDFYFGYDPAAGVTIAVRNDEDPAGANIVGMGLNPATFEDLAGVDGWSGPVQIGNLQEDLLVLQTGDGLYYKLWNFRVDLDTFMIAFDVDEITELGQIPEPSTLLLLGLGLLGLFGFRRRQKKGKGTLRLLLLLALSGGVLFYGASPATAQQSYDCSAQTEIPTSECEDLVALYNSTNGDNWTENGGWLSTDTPCSWHGVWCNDESPRNVIAINLRDNQLSGSIPDFNLPQLTELYLSSNQLNGNIPDFSGLPNLTKLDLEDNQLSGSIPDFSGLSNLTDLNLGINQLSGNIPDFSGLPDLTVLWLNHNQLSGNIPDFSHLPQLTNLYLSNNQLKGNIPNFSALPNLDYLDLNNNKLEGSIPDFSGLMQLKDLLLNNNQLSGTIPTSIGNLSKLEVFSVANNSQLSDSLPRSLINTLLYPSGRDKKFYFNGTNLCEPQEKEFQNWLAALDDWQGTGVKCPFPTRDIPQAETDALVALYNSADGGNWVNTIANADPWLATDSSPCDWDGVTCAGGHVTGLDLSSNNLVGTLAPELGNLTSLHALALNDNSLSGSLPANLTNITALTAFNVSDTNLCEPQEQEFQDWLAGIGAYAGSGKACSGYLASGDLQDANKTEANTDDDDLCWAAAASNILEWGDWDTAAYATAAEIFEQYGAHWENKKGSAQDAWNWWISGAEPGEFGDYSAEWAHVDVPGAGGYWTDYDFNDWYHYSEQMTDIPWLLEDGYGVALTLASDIADPTSALADNHAITLWGYEEYEGMITDLWVTDSDDLAGELFRLHVEDLDGVLYLSGGELRASYGYPQGEWYIDEIHALKQRADLVTITTIVNGSGSIAPESAAGELLVPPNSVQRFTITPVPGSLLVHLLVDGVEQLAECVEFPETGSFSYALQVGTTDATLEAVFESAAGSATITADAGGGGSVMPGGATTVSLGTSHSVTITPEAGYTLTQLLVNGAEKTGDCPASGVCDYTFANVSGDAALTASFQPTANMAAITASAYTQDETAQGGGIAPAGNVRVLRGQNQTFSMRPDDKYQFVDAFVKKPSENVWTSVREDLVYGRPEWRYTFANVSEDQEIKVRFAKKDETLIEIKSRCVGPYGQDWECANVTNTETGEPLSLSISVDGAEYDLVTGLRVSLSEAYALFLEFQGDNFVAWEYCDRRERIVGGIAYTEETLCVRAVLGFGPGHGCGN